MKVNYNGHLYTAVPVEAVKTSEIYKQIISGFKSLKTNHIKFKNPRGVLHAKLSTGAWNIILIHEENDNTIKNCIAVILN